MIFFKSLHSEWLKTKRSMSFWLTILGGFFIPIIYLISFIYHQSSINQYSANSDIWIVHFNKCWQNMAAFLLPMGVILATSLITQMEYRNNTWKQLHTTPQSYTTIYFAKLTVIILLTIQFFIFFNIGILLSGALPCLIFNGNFSVQPIPVMFFIKENIKYFIACLPIIALQYLISLKFKNFLIPIGIGLFALIGTLIALSWKYIFLSPFCYCILTIMPGRKISIDINIHLLALIYFSIILMVNYYLYLSKKEKG
jgi:lantibiotic transport system permease protein